MKKKTVGKRRKRKKRLRRFRRNEGEEQEDEEEGENEGALWARITKYTTFAVEMSPPK